MLPVGYQDASLELTRSRTLDTFVESYVLFMVLTVPLNGIGFIRGQSRWIAIT